MLTCQILTNQLLSGVHDARLERVYCCRDTAALAQVRSRAALAVERFRDFFDLGGDSPAALFSGPGRTEIGGNHTDHQHGRVLAASVNMDMLACAAPNGSGLVRIHSEGYPTLTVDLCSLAPVPEERDGSAALVRGVAARMADLGFHPQGFDAYICSSVPAGSGLSSSAAYEVLVGTIFNTFFCENALSPVQLAQIGQYAENIYFGKPCGLMDQMASAVGGTVAIDFRDPQNPVVRKITYDFARSGHTLCIIDSGADHADLTDEYAAITREMGAVAAHFGKTVLRDVSETEFRAAVPALRRELGDRAVLRAIHFYADDRRADEEARALEAGDFGRFLSLVRESGRSSSLNLQNTFAASNPRQQAIPLALCRAEELLDGAGAVRVHGGGFAGTIQAFVPNELLNDFVAGMDALLGRGMCHILAIRPEGGCLLA